MQVDGDLINSPKGVLIFNHKPQGWATQFCEVIFDGLVSMTPQFAVKKAFLMPLLFTF